jgi:virulence-associated protein VapD
MLMLAFNKGQGDVGRAKTACDVERKQLVIVNLHCQLDWIEKCLRD